MTAILGARYRLKFNYDLEHIGVFVVAGATGIVSDISYGNASLKMDEPVPNLVDSEWENELVFSEDDDPGCFDRACEFIPGDHPPVIQTAIGLLADYGSMLAHAHHPEYENHDALHTWIAGAIEAQITDPDYEQADEMAEEN